MSLARTDENELLTALHGGVVEDRPWALFLERLRARIEADCCCLWARRNTGGWSPIELAKSRKSTGMGNIEALAAFDTMRPSRIYRQAEMVGEGSPDIREDGDGRHMMIGHGQGREVILSAYIAQDEFQAGDAALLLNLAPHMHVAFRIYDALLRQRLKSTMLDHILADMATGWILLDGQGRVLETSMIARTMIEERQALLVGSDGRLHCVGQDAQSALEAAMADSRNLPRAAWLDIDPPLQMVVTEPTEDAGRHMPTARYQLLIRKIRESVMKDGQYLKELFGLTRSEALLAARIAEGDSIVQAADALSLTPETARNYSKRIYAKTGTRGQADLVRLLLGGVSVLG
ncbi:DNA-binding CsgD family transcriptional regulator [Sphingobium sp. OAS761]|uniref:helix-turn-helix transcriptional regulator n=1 Tax=Sphingobium sp. OAS761 TaxID=2817901 RepID=UPI00209C7935|nr:helix-turn-helix transcriptional regulator [Sphingobium sp. OAS761]MCP1470265.1 DNA-binding CsgD family transcriptional regulator [Sphingobium sp. OAS761]